MNYKNIVVERSEKDLIFRDTTLVMYNHRPSEIIGSAKLSYVNGEIVANIRLFDYNLDRLDLRGKLLYPSIGYNSQTGCIHNLGLCDGKNVDDSITPIQIL